MNYLPGPLPRIVPHRKIFTYPQGTWYKALCAKGAKVKYFGFVIFLLFSSGSQSIEIDNFKSGLMCGINKNDMGWVCFEREEILITGQSSCESAGEEFKCTWYGYSFDYKNAKKGQEINCVYTESEAVKSMNLYSGPTAGSRVGEFKFTLSNTEGHFVNPQYSVLGLSRNDEPHKIIQDVTCSSEGEKLYEYRFISIYPSRF